MNAELLIQEFTYRTSRSGGKGGQNVNKVETKVEARFDVAASAALTDEEKAYLLEKLADKISAEGMLSATNQTDRSQLTNKEKATEKLLKLVEKGLVKPKKRRKVPIPAGVKEARLENKKRVSEKKATRQTVRINPKNEE
ncbi:MAG: alternative ribosome rescue aminoacyl-tRNA hydrolase ArfB [Saprospiraceae bacterium]|nr:alternative ribosome rescue aminoacyl-tRNA hydrolase ArfB [Saprospiraceae bacterium]MDZ4705847.1 alternative ribosome rescue aminoacyl-tRNA hydrolase ArfB [Saprospiraceae bacterium]